MNVSTGSMLWEPDVHHMSMSLTHAWKGRGKGEAFSWFQLTESYIVDFLK